MKVSKLKSGKVGQACIEISEELYPWAILFKISKRPMPWKEGNWGSGLQDQ